ncbi:MAG: tripartite tricarboxylate transporter TctB family protein [Comamonadaceae bacterium]|jgi:Tripartite tricarboxylate transporter TctB family
MSIKSQKDFFSGVVFMAVGGAFAWGATTYTVGSGARMGPGYFPLMLGVLLAIIGAVIAFKSMVIETEDGEKIGKWIWRPVGYIVAANLAFGVLLGGLPSIHLPPMGMVIAIIALTLISAKAGTDFILKEILILSAILVVGSYVTFILLLKLQIQVWPAFITG